METTLVRRSSSWPAVVDARTARIVAAITVTVSVIAIVTGWSALVWVLAASFTVRAIFGPRKDPLAASVSSAVKRWWSPSPTAGAPKRLAATMGAGFTLTATVLLALNLTVGWWVLGALIFAAFLEAAFGYCLACKIHAIAAKFGIVQPCVECEDDNCRI